MKKFRNPNAQRAFEILSKVIDEVQGPGGVTVVCDEGTPRVEKEKMLYEGFLKEGHSDAVAREKAREFLELSELALSKTPDLPC